LIKDWEVSAKKALELGEKRYTTTLLVSPLKSQEQLKESGKRIDEKLGTEFIFLDFRSFGGTQLQNQVAKKEQLYRQDYCGCIFGLKMQREAKEEFVDELISPITAQILPASIEERLRLYLKRIKLEEEGREYKILKQRFLNLPLAQRVCKG